MCILIYIYINIYIYIVLYITSTILNKYIKIKKGKQL